MKHNGKAKTALQYANFKSMSLSISLEFIVFMAYEHENICIA